MVSPLSKVAVGVSAEVSRRRRSAECTIAKATVVDRVVAAASGTFGVRLELTNPTYRLPTGLKCKVRFGR